MTCEFWAETVGGGGALNTTTGLESSWRLSSVVSTAESDTDSATESATSKVAWPFEAVTWGFALPTAALPELELADSVTVLPATGLSEEVSSVTVTVVPPPTPVNAGDGLAVIVDALAETGACTPKVTVAVGVSVTESVVSVAL